MNLNDRIGRRIKLRDLHIFLAVVEEGGISKAGRRLGVSQPAVSRAISDMEDTFGVCLLDRNLNGIKPTPYGFALVRRALNAFDELRQSVQDIELISDPTAGELRIGSSEALAVSVISPIIKELSGQYPKMTFHYETILNKNVVRDLKEGSIDLAILRLEKPGNYNELDTEILFNNILRVAASANNRWHRKKKVALADLVDEPWTMNPLNGTFGMIVVEAFRAHGLEPPRLTVSTSLRYLRDELVATGRFLTLVPNHVAELQGRGAKLRILPIELPSTRRPVAIVTLKGRSSSPLAQVFSERVRTFTKSLAKRNA